MLGETPLAPTLYIYMYACELNTSWGPGLAGTVLQGLAYHTARPLQVQVASLADLGHDVADGGKHGLGEGRHLLARKRIHR